MCLSYGRQFLLRVGSDHTTSCPSGEDIAVVLSFVSDPSTPEKALKKFCITTHASKKTSLPHMITGTGEELITALANLIRLILKLQAGSEKCDLPTTQFYV